MSQFVATTSLSDMRALGSQADRSLYRVEGILERAFKGRLSFSLADPIPRKDGAGIDWYTESDELLTKLTALPQDTAEFHRRKLAADMTDIRKLADAYKARKEPSWLAMAAALKSAMTYPGDGNVWIAGDASSASSKAIITGWGYEAYVPQSGVSRIVGRVPTTDSAVRVVFADAADSLAEQAKPVSNRNREIQPWTMGWLLPFLLWVLVIGLALAIGWRLIPACGIRIPFAGQIIYGFGDGANCRQNPNPILTSTTATSQSLQAQAKELGTKLRKFVQTCVANHSESDAAKKTAQEALERTGIAQNDDETTITLIWHNRNDIDIQALCPDGNLARVANDACGGHVDHDDNGSGSGPSPLVDNPVEHLTWKTADMMPGRYKVLVRHYSNSSQDADTDYTAVLQRGNEYRRASGRSRYGSQQAVEVMSFDVP